MSAPQYLSYADCLVSVFGDVAKHCSDCILRSFGNEQRVLTFETRDKEDGEPLLVVRYIPQADSTRGQADLLMMVDYSGVQVSLSTPLDDRKERRQAIMTLQSRTEDAAELTAEMKALVDFFIANRADLRGRGFPVKLYGRVWDAQSFFGTFASADSESGCRLDLTDLRWKCVVARFKDRTGNFGGTYMSAKNADRDLLLAHLEKMRDRVLSDAGVDESEFKNTGLWKLTYLHHAWRQRF